MSFERVDHWAADDGDTDATVRAAATPTLTACLDTFRPLVTACTPAFRIAGIAPEVSAHGKAARELRRTRRRAAVWPSHRASAGGLETIDFRADPESESDFVFVQQPLGQRLIQAALSKLLFPPGP